MGGGIIRHWHVDRYGCYATTIDFYVVRCFLRLPTDLMLRCKVSLALAYRLDATF